jgi:hypothetical protein
MHIRKLLKNNKQLTKISVTKYKFYTSVHRFYSC